MAPKKQGKKIIPRPDDRIAVGRAKYIFKERQNEEVVDNLPEYPNELFLTVNRDIALTLIQGILNQLWYHPELTEFQIKLYGRLAENTGV